MARRQGHSLRWVARGLFAALALTAMVLLVRRAGAGSFLDAFHAGLPWLPLLLLLEALRIAADLVALWLLCGPDARRLPLAAWIRLHLVTNTALVVMPGGRMISEGMKIARLGPVLGAGRATAVVAVHHALTLVGVALTCAVAGLVAWRVTGASLLTAALAAHAASCLILATTLRITLHRASIPRPFARHSAAAAPLLDDLRAASRVLPLLPPGALAAKLVNRVAQIAQLVVLLHAVGGASGLARAWLAGGVSLLGGAIGEVSIAQLGCTEGAFVLSASALSLGVGGAVAITSLVRAVQLFWSAVGAVASAFEPLDRNPSAR
ncbi:hypothetical protein [Polyangium sp. 6x1]|uniref:hypothetical protein n=1 Tax=Polyangium sp. 6x1 TaxID=3042689 RepID=UPI0024824280|nr:hypothetical protein [Polyangium sp. 6x1]MDI1444348.1 hypothetical protein [Polyangium sp. 6x1]